MPAELFEAAGERGEVCLRSRKQRIAPKATHDLMSAPRLPGSSIDAARTREGRLHDGNLFCQLLRGAVRLDAANGDHPLMVVRPCYLVQARCRDEVVGKPLFAAGFHEIKKGNGPLPAVEIDMVIASSRSLATLRPAECRK